MLQTRNIEELVGKMVALEGSDLHIKVGAPPSVRVHGRLEPLEGYEVLRPADTEGIVREVLSEKLVGEFEEEGEADLSYVAEGVGRFRVNAFRQRGSASMVMRFIPFGVPRLDELGLPDAIGDLAREERGIILVTGTTGSGKSTTLAAMIDQMNRADPKHIVTIEDPIEYLHRDDKCLINQREVGSDTVSFSRALRRVLRQDPDVTSARSGTPRPPR
jgi:twitching motility protein PilT